MRTATRGARGRRYPLATLLAIAVAAKLAGYHGTTAIGEFSQALTQRQLRALRAFYSHRLGRFTAPSTTAFVKVLTALDPDALDRAARAWAAQHASRAEPVAIDGKSICGAAQSPLNLTFFDREQWIRSCPFLQSPRIQSSEKGVSELARRVAQDAENGRVSE